MLQLHMAPLRSLPSCNAPDFYSRSYFFSCLGAAVSAMVIGSHYFSNQAASHVTSPQSPLRPPAAFPPLLAIFHLQCQSHLIRHHSLLSAHLQAQAKAAIKSRLLVLQSASSAPIRKSNPERCLAPSPPLHHECIVQI
jgi:hypothetical protein